MRRYSIVPPTNPGASSSAVVFDTGAITTAEIRDRGRDSAYNRCRVGFYTNVADAVLLVQWAAPGSSNLRTVDSVTVSANTYTQRDILLQPGRTKISITTTTAPTTWELGAELIRDQALSQ